MKSGLFTLSLFFIFALRGFSQGTSSYIIEGDLSGINSAVHFVYLTYSANGERKNDSVTVKNGKYMFKGKIEEPLLARLSVRYSPEAGADKQTRNVKRDVAAFFLQPGKITVTSVDSFSNVTVTGSLADADFRRLNKSLEADEAKMENIMTRYSAMNRSKDTNGIKLLEEEYDEVAASLKKGRLHFLESNVESPIALFLLNEIAGWDINPDEVEPLFKRLPVSQMKKPSAIALGKQIELAKKTAVGRKAEDFIQNDTLGKPVRLSSFQGKYVLVDFWASWCGPCRNENPNLVDAFKKYNSKGFEVLGVSLDQPTGKDKWMKAIHDDQLWWTQVSDLKFWKNAVAVQYGIQAIPQNLLIDPQGVIIGKNLRGEKLQSKLAELFNKP